MGRRRRKRANGLGSVVRRGSTWAVRWRQNGLRRFMGGFETEAEAEEARKQITADIAGGRAGVRAKSTEAKALAKLAPKWIERRKKTHRSAAEDHWRWEKHLRPWFGHLRPDQVDQALLRRFIEAKLTEPNKLADGSLGDPLSSSTVRLLILEMSALFTDLVEQGHAEQNPVKMLPRATRKLVRSAHDPHTTPFIERLEDVRRLFLALEEPINIAFALGAYAGLRPGEALALKWPNVDLATKRIHVRESVDGPLKDLDSRVALIADGLYHVLAKWQLATGGKGRVVPSMRSDGEYCDQHTLRAHLAEAFAKLKLEPVTWYQATRHSFASHWVLRGGTLEEAA
jgi:integrase